MEGVNNNLAGMELVKSLEAQGLALKEQGKGKESSHITASKLFAFIYLYQSILLELNILKGKMDEACKLGLVEDFKKSLAEFKHVAYKLWDAKKALKSRRKFSHLTIHADLLQDTYRKISFIENTITGGERWIKEAGMSPAQLNAAKKASIRMQMAWGC